MSASEETILSLVGMIYEAALDESKWQAFLDAFSGAVGSKSAILRSTDYEVCQASFATSVGYDPAWQEAYKKYYISQDYFAPFFKTVELNTVFTDRNAKTVISPEERVKTEFYNDYSKVAGFEYAMGTVLARDQNLMLQFAAQRGKSDGAFGEDEVRLMSVLAPHAARAVKLHRRISSVTVEKDWALGSLDKLRMAVILTNKAGELVFANRSAEEMLTRGGSFRMHMGRLILPKLPQTAQLYRLIGEAADGAPGSTKGGDMRIELPTGESMQCVVTPIPLEFSSRWNISLASGCVALFLSVPGGLQLSPKRLVVLYGLTPAEARLASRLATLRTLEQAADDLCISINTARTHLRAIFAKTATGSQSELLVLLTTSSLAQSRDDN